MLLTTIYYRLISGCCASSCPARSSFLYSHSEYGTGHNSATNIAGSTPKTSRPHVVKAKHKPPKHKPPKHHCGHDQDVLPGGHCQKHDDDDDDTDVRHAASSR